MNVRSFIGVAVCLATVFNAVPTFVSADITDDVSEDTSESISAETSEDDSEELFESYDVCEDNIVLPDNAIDGLIASGTCGSNAFWTLDADGRLEISGSGEVSYDSYFVSNRPWNYYTDSIIEVIIDEGITNVPASAFDSCGNLTSVVIAGTVSEIEMGAFASCSKLSSVELKNGIKTIGNTAFSLDPDLSEITIPYTVTHIGQNAFGTISGQQMDVYLLANPKTLTWDSSLYSDNVVIHVDGGALAFCINKFEKYSELFVGDMTYGQCGEDLNPVFWNYDPDSKTLSITGNGPMRMGGSADKYNLGAPWYSFRSEIVTINISDGVTEISNSTFSYCSSLRNVNIPDSVKSIASYAFDNCKALEEIVLPDSITEIGEAAFRYCEKLAHITIPSKIKIINESTFYRCLNLEEVNIPSGVEEIRHDAFYLTGIKTLIFNDGNLELIGIRAFTCNNVKDIYCYMNPASYLNIWRDNKFSLDGTTQFHVPSNLVDTFSEKFSSFKGVNFVGDLPAMDAYVKGYTVSLSDSIGLNFYLSVEDASDISVYFTWGEGTDTKTHASYIHNEQGVLVPANENGANYKATCGVAARSLTDEITLTIMRGDAVVLKTSYSIEKYLNSLLSSYSELSEDAYYLELGSLIYSIKNYGYYSQNYFEYKKDNRPYIYGYNNTYENTSLDKYKSTYDSEKYTTDKVDESNLTIKSIGTLDPSAGLIYKSAAVICKSKTEIRLSFTKTDIFDAANLKAVYKNKELRIEEEGDTVYIFISDITPVALYQPISFSINGKIYKYHYIDYVVRVVKSSDSDIRAFANTAKRLWVYAKVAYEYNEFVKNM